MAVPGSVEPGANAGLFGSLRAFWGVVLAIFHTRLDLLTVELEEETRRVVQLLVVGLAALFCIGMTMFFFVVLFWDNAKVVLGIVCGVSLLLSIILLFAVRYMIRSRPKFLSQTLAELHRDVESFRPPAKTDEVKL
jgi:uncharacterized membrane protein YqjE